MSDQTKENKPQFELQHIYVKDVSFESPNTPEVFKKKWEPEISLDLNTKSRPIEKELFDIVLTVTVNAKVADSVAYIAEVQQAGIFSVKHFEQGQLEQFLAVFCPNILYPYAREAISSLIVKGGFAPLYLAPVNFDALYAQEQQKAVQKKA